MKNLFSRSHQEKKGCRKLQCYEVNHLEKGSRINIGHLEYVQTSWDSHNPKWRVIKSIEQKEETVNCCEGQMRIA